MKNNDRFGRGFSVTELLIVIAVAVILIGASLPIVDSALRQTDANVAMNTVITLLREGRQMSIDQGRLYKFSAQAPRYVRLERREADGAWHLMVERSLPQGFGFRVEPGLPTVASQTPDRMGASVAIDLRNSSEVFFQPDGSATTRSGQPFNGILYVGKPGHLDCARAITLLGATGRIKSWTYAQVSESSWRWME